MRISIKATNLKLTAALKDYVDKKIGGLEKFLKNFDEDTIEVSVELGKPSQHHRHGDVYYAEVNLNIAGKLLRTKATTTDTYASIDQVKDELQREIKRYKEKTITKNRRLGRSFKKARALSPLSRFRNKK